MLFLGSELQWRTARAHGARAAHGKAACHRSALVCCDSAFASAEALMFNQMHISKSHTNLRKQSPPLKSTQTPFEHRGFSRLLACLGAAASPGGACSPPCRQQPPRRVCQGWRAMQCPHGTALAGFFCFTDFLTPLPAAIGTDKIQQLLAFPCTQKEFAPSNSISYSFP